VLAKAKFSASVLQSSV